VASSRQRRRRAGRERTAEQRRLVDPACPADLELRIRQAIALGIAGQGIRRDERLPDLIARVCPGVVAFAMLEGFRVNLDLPANTHGALCLGMIEVEIRAA
jgi:hypothetical protein